LAHTSHMYTRPSWWLPRAWLTPWGAVHPQMDTLSSPRANNLGLPRFRGLAGDTARLRDRTYDFLQTHLPAWIVSVPQLWHASQ
jgi:hypothetical protein